LAELNEEIEQENQKVSREVNRDIHYPLRKRLKEKLSLGEKEQEAFVNELIEYFLKLNSDIPDWIFREDERRKARMEIAERSKKIGGRLSKKKIHFPSLNI